MICAVYARKSTEQRDTDEGDKSVARQVEHATAYILAKGWTVAEDCIFVDDAISGGEFERRPGFVRLMNSLKPRPAFQVLVMSEGSRLGRESIEAVYAMKQLVQAGVRVFLYMSDTECVLNTPIAKVMLSLSSFADELERDKARQRTYDAMLRKARAGHVTGGVVFGYTNVEILGTLGKRSHVERRIDETQAALVRAIFDWYGRGWGYARIAKALNAEHAPSPRPTEDKPAGWSPSSVRAILRRDLYRGVVTWNRSQKRDLWGRQRQQARPAAEWMTREAPDLRIVTDAQWAAAQARFRRTRITVETAQGLKAIVRRDFGSRYLLSGHARCGTCGWAMTVVTRRHTGRTRKAFYACLSHHKRGPEVCANGRLLPLEAADAAVLGKLRADTLAPGVVSAILAVVFAQMTPAHTASTVAGLQRDLQALDAKVANLTKGIEAGGALEALVAQLHTRQQEREQLLVALASAQTLDQLQVDRPQIEAEVQTQVARWRDLLTESVEDGRTALREVLVEPLVFTPEAGCVRFRARVATGALVAGAVTAGVDSTLVASPPGFEPGFQP